MAGREWTVAVSHLSNVDLKCELMTEGFLYLWSSDGAKPGWRRNTVVFSLSHAKFNLSVYLSGNSISVLSDKVPHLWDRGHIFT